MKRLFKWFFLLVMISSLTGCFTWIRAYKTYLQMNDFDKHFSVTVNNGFNWHFKDPILYSKDFTSLSKIHPTSSVLFNPGKSLRYVFRKIDDKGVIIKPETQFRFDLDFNADDKLTRWTFSPLFLEMAPAEFLEISIRSIGGAKINKETRQLKADTNNIKKISVSLPQKAHVLSQLGEPLSIEEGMDNDIYHFHFLLDTQKVEKGYEERALSIVKLTFDKVTNELIKMAGRFAGLKISINYQKYVEGNSASSDQTAEHPMQMESL